MKYLIIIMFCIFIQACEVEQKEIPEDSFIERKMEKIFAKLTNPNDSILFKMDTLTDFQWDSLYVFTYYRHSPNDINKYLGEFASDRTRNLDNNEGDNMFVFKSKSNIICCVNFGSPILTDLYFHCICEIGYTPENGIFKVKLNYPSKGVNAKAFYEVIAER